MLSCVEESIRAGPRTGRYRCSWGEEQGTESRGEQKSRGLGCDFRLSRYQKVPCKLCPPTPPVTFRDIMAQRHDSSELFFLVLVNVALSLLACSIRRLQHPSCKGLKGHTGPSVSLPLPAALLQGWAKAECISPSLPLALPSARAGFKRRVIPEAPNGRVPNDPVSDQLLILGSERTPMAGGVSFAHLPRVFLRQSETAPLLADVYCL